MNKRLARGPRDHGYCRVKGRGDVEIHETTVSLRDRRLVLPTYAQSERERGFDVPVVRHEGIENPLPKVLVCIPECYGTCRGNRQQEIREVVPCRRPRECEC